ncbi:MAG: L-2-hydroxyglutarate oxidase [Bacteroidales bacterium]|nr:L-2-hydroxyglutarate oxidase [Bacteroidales bacterium]MDT8374733.1 L-2-hydroxyglutarate oxidase [Bacteroidales bacterium]
MMVKESFDYLVIGAGIIGLSIARELIVRFPGSKIAILEKEHDVARHSSGRNSGVLHAGFYYTADSLKARFTCDGNRLMREYCYNNKLKINETKKVVVAKNEDELPGLFELEKRGKTNGVEVNIIDEKELAEIDPNVKTFKQALWSPTTATVDPEEVNLAIKSELEQKGVRQFFGEGYAVRLDGNKIKTTRGNILEATKLINAAGLYADRVAKDFGFSRKYTIIPFKGIYLKYTGTRNPVRTNVYPVPNLKNPFLGVHYTVTVDGHVKIGPTSMPAFWRENYDGTANFKAGEMAVILSREAKLFIKNSFGFRSLAIDEIKKYNRRYFTSLAASMVHELDARGFTDWGKPGIRAQLLDITTDELVMDFIIEGDKNSTHVLNAVSPAFTCAFPFAKHVIDNYIT